MLEISKNHHISVVGCKFLNALYEEYAKDGNISEVREIETSVGCFGQMSEQIEFILNPKMTEVKSLDDELSYEASEMDDG